MVPGVRAPTSGPPPPRTGRQEVLRGPWELATVPVARRFVREAPAAWARLQQEEAGSVLITELTGNAVLHAQAPVVLALLEVADGVLLQFSDGSTGLPLLAPRSDTSSGGGRGGCVCCTCTH